MCNFSINCCSNCVHLMIKHCVKHANCLYRGRASRVKQGQPIRKSYFVFCPFFITVPTSSIICFVILIAPICCCQKKKWTRSAECSKKKGHPSIFSWEWMGKQHVWCVHSMLECWKNITFVATMWVFMSENMATFKDSVEKKVDEVLSGLKKLQSACTYSQEVSDAAVKAS